jgi:hypothetical protein
MAEHDWRPQRIRLQGIDPDGGELFPVGTDVDGVEVPVRISEPPTRGWTESFVRLADENAVDALQSKPLLLGDTIRLQLYRASAPEVKAAWIALQELVDEVNRDYEARRAERKKKLVGVAIAAREIADQLEMA